MLLSLNIVIIIIIIIIMIINQSINRCSPDFRVGFSRARHTQPPPVQLAMAASPLAIRV